MGTFFEEFKRFALKGDVLDLAVAVVVGNAFGQVVNSLVSDIITPLLGLTTGASQTDFKHLAVTLHSSYQSGTTTVPALTLNYGNFIGTIFNFLIIALSIFLVFKLFSVTRRRFVRSGKEEQVPTYEKPAQERLLEEIRDILKKEHPEETLEH